MKYVMFEGPYNYFPVIFPDAIPHITIAEMVEGNKELEKMQLKRVSAGFIDIGTNSTFGESETLGLGSRIVDQTILNGYQYGHGIKDTYKPGKFAPFEGDGRKKVDPLIQIYGAKSMPVTYSTARSLITSFLETGHSHHSGAGNMVWVIVAFCREQSLKYKYEGKPGLGFSVHLLNENGEEKSNGNL